MREDGVVEECRVGDAVEFGSIVGGIVGHGEDVAGGGIHDDDATAICADAVEAVLEGAFGVSLDIAVEREDDVVAVNGGLHDVVVADCEWDVGNIGDGLKEAVATAESFFKCRFYPVLADAVEVDEAEGL